MSSGDWRFRLSDQLSPETGFEHFFQVLKIFKKNLKLKKKKDLNGNFKDVSENYR